jgi:hypothetical protein
MATGTRALTLKLIADIDDFNKNLDKGTKDVEGFGSKMSDIGKKVGVALAAAAAAAGAMAIKIGVDAVKAASNLSETQSKVSVIFGESSDAINKFASTAATKLGQSKQQALDAASTFATFGKSAGLAGNDLVSFSTELTTLSADLASFYNTSPEDAITAIGAALRGESEPIRKYGILLNDAALKQEAMNMGIYNGTGALTAQQKVLAAQAVIMKQTSDAQGDFERTSDGLANQQRILAAQFENVKSTIGTALLPVVLEMVGAFNKNVLPAIVAVGDAIGSGGLTGYISNIKDLIKNLFVPILEGLKFAWDKIATALRENSDSFQKLANFIKDVVAPVLGTTLKYSLEIVGTVFGKIIDIIGGAIDKIASFVEAVKNMVNAVISAYNRLPTPDIALIGAGGGGASFTSGGAPGAIAGGGASSFGGILSGLSGIATGMSGLAGAAGGKGGGGITAANKAALAQIQADTEFAQFLLDQLSGQGIFTETRQAQSAAFNQQLAGSVTVNFNGVVGDGESVKRSLIELFNESEARGTLGATAFTGL